MESFDQVFGVVMALCIGIIILTIFFTAIGYFKRTTQGLDVVKMKGFIKEGRLIHVHLTTGKTLSEVRFIGFTSQATTLPHQFARMVVLETAKGARLYVRADSVRIFEEVDATS